MKNLNKVKKNSVNIRQPKIKYFLPIVEIKYERQIALTLIEIVKAKEGKEWKRVWCGEIFGPIIIFEIYTDFNCIPKAVRKKNIKIVVKDTIESIMSELEDKNKIQEMAQKYLNREKRPLGVIYNAVSVKIGE